jgi:adenylate kinase
MTSNSPPLAGGLKVAIEEDDAVSADGCNLAKTVAVIGPPASGKGTQCQRLAAESGFVHISLGDTFRAAVQAGTELGRTVQPFLERGQFVPDEMVIRFLEDRLSQPDAVRAAGCLVDGFPRTPEQAAMVMHPSCKVKFDRMIVLDVPVDVLPA